MVPPTTATTIATSSTKNSVRPGWRAEAGDWEEATFGAEESEGDGALGLALDGVWVAVAAGAAPADGLFVGGG